MQILPSRSLLARIPRLHSGEQIPVRDKLIHLHFHLDGCHWYVAEYDGKEVFWGFVNLNDPTNAEWGYFTFSELHDTVVDIALYFTFHQADTLDQTHPTDLPREIEWDHAWVPIPFREILLDSTDFAEPM